MANVAVAARLSIFLRDMAIFRSCELQCLWDGPVGERFKPFFRRPEVETAATATGVVQKFFHFALNLCGGRLSHT
jgi:hypothetical protein